MTVPEEAETELLALSAALRAELELLRESGAVGLEHASAELIRSRSNEPPPGDLSVTAATVSARPVQQVTAPRPTLPAPATGEARLGPTGDAHVRLAALAAEVSHCTRCRLHEKRKQTVFARGLGSSGLCFVGEGPGADEDAQGFPFVGKAGQLLDRMIQAMGFERDAVYVCNVVKCRPPENRKPEIDEIAACSSYLHEQLELIQPQVIVALGASAVQGMLGTTEGITRMRGTWKLYRGKIPVMPTFHPAYLLRQPEAKRNVWDDLQAVLERMGLPTPSRRG